MKTSNKILLVFLAIILLSIALIMFTIRKDLNGFSLVEKTYKTSEQDYSFKQEYKISSPANLQIATTGGNINVNGMNDSTIEVSYIVTKNGKVLDITFDELKEIADVEIINSDTSLNIRIIRTKEKRISIGFNIKTPLKTSINLNTSGGNITANQIEGKQWVNTSGGNIILEQITGTANAHTSGGNVSIGNSKADFDLSTSGGNISMNNIDGKLQASTSGGNIDAGDIKHGLTAHTSGGNIDVKNASGTFDVTTSGGSIGINDVSGSVKAFTSGGDISASMIRLQEKLELETDGGSIVATIPTGLGLNLDLSADQINTSLANFSGLAKKERIQGKMNGGGILVHLTTSGGSISLQYK